MKKNQYILIILVMACFSTIYIYNVYLSSSNKIQFLSNLRVKSVCEADLLYVIDTNNELHTVTGYEDLGASIFYSRNSSVNTSEVLMKDLLDIRHGLNQCLYMLMADGKVFQKIENNYNQYSLIEGLENIQKISTGENFGLALSSDGIVWAWGDNSKGQLGNNLIDYQSNPVKILIENPIINISTGYENVVALDKQGDVWVWGDNKNGQCGLDGKEIISVPSKLLLPEKIVQVCSGNSNALALGESGLVYSWGDTVEVLGTDMLNRKNSNKPQQIETLNNIEAIFMGYSKPTATAIDAKGNVYLWGFTYDYKKYVGDIPFEYKPKKIYTSQKVIVALPTRIGVAIIEDDGILKFIW